MEAIVAIVGFLGVGKTTFLKEVVKEYLRIEWNPFIVLNDYENANMDAQSFLDILDISQINALSGSCICCSGVNELRLQVNSIKPREKGITIIEANGTTDATSLMGFLGVGMKEHFLPPVQVGIVDVRSWQKRGYHNELEANQIQLSSLVILNFTDQVSRERVVQVEEEIREINPLAIITPWSKFDFKSLSTLHPIKNETTKMDHHKSHWSSCSVDLPNPLSSARLDRIMNEIPKEILRLKGCTKLDEDAYYSYFERVPTGEVFVRPYSGNLVTGPKLVSIGPGSDPEKLQSIIENSENEI